MRRARSCGGVTLPDETSLRAVKRGAVDRALGAHAKASHTDVLAAQVTIAAWGAVFGVTAAFITRNRVPFADPQDTLVAVGRGVEVIARGPGRSEGRSSVGEVGDPRSVPSARAGPRRPGSGRRSQFR